MIKIIIPKKDLGNGLYLAKIDQFMSDSGYLPDDEKYDPDTEEYILSYFSPGE